MLLGDTNESKIDPLSIHTHFHCVKWKIIIEQEDRWLLLHVVTLYSCRVLVWNKAIITHGTYFGLLLFLHSNLLLDLEACVANQAEGNEVAI